MSAQRNVSTGVIGQLNQEWAHLLDDRPANEQVAEWARSDPPLSGLDSLALLEEAASGPISAQIDEMFYSLVCRAVNREGLAARIVLQLMLPAVVRIAERYTRRSEDAEDLRQLTLESLWEVIMTYPVEDWTDHVPGHLAWSTRKAVRDTVVAQPPEFPSEGLDEVPPDEADINPSERLLRYLTDAVERGHVTAEEATLLLARYSGDSGDNASWKTYGNLTVLASALSSTPNAVKQRCSRIVARLAEEARHDSSA